MPTQRRAFLLPVTALSRVWRGKYLTARQGAYGWAHLQVAGSPAPLRDARTLPRVLAPFWQPPGVV
jgi:hypothetical protein